MRLQIGKWGNSLAVRLPSSLIKKAALKEGDMLEVEVEPNGTMHLLHAHVFDKKAFLTDLEALHTHLLCTGPVIDCLREEARY